MASMQADLRTPAGTVYFSNIPIDDFDHLGWPLSHKTLCVGVEYKERIFVEPHEIFGKSLVPVGGTTICTRCCNIYRGLKQYNKELEYIWTPKYLPAVVDSKRYLPTIHPAHI